MNVKLEDMKEIPFTHNDYLKFRSRYFTTIRGKSWDRTTKIGEFRKCVCKKELICVTKVFAKTLIKIQNIGIEILKADAERVHETIRNHQDFVKLMNQLRKSWMPQADLDSQVTVIYLEQFSFLEHLKNNQLDNQGLNKFLKADFPIITVSEEDLS